MVMNEVYNFTIGYLGLGILIGFIIGMLFLTLIFIITVEKNNSRYKNFLHDKYGEKALENYNKQKFEYKKQLKKWEN